MTLQQFVAPAAAFAERQAAQRAHEGDRFARVHRRIKAALLGQIAHLRSRIERLIGAEHPAGPARRVDDAEKDAEQGRLARAVGPEEAVDAARRHRKGHSVDGARLAEILDELRGFDCDSARRPVMRNLLKH